jgi:integrase
MKYAGREHYRWVLDRHILPAIGDMKMRDVNLAHLQKLCSLKLDSGLSVQTVTHIRSGLSAIFSRASALRIVEGVNPASAIRLPEMVRKERHTPTDEEARALLAVLEDPSYAPCREMAILSCSCSTHFAEMCALRWKRVNLTDRPMIADGKNLPPFSMAIRENYYRKEFGSPKTKARNRIEPLTPELVRVLSSLKEGTTFDGPEDLVFCGEGGKPLDGDVMRPNSLKRERRREFPGS